MDLQSKALAVFNDINKEINAYNKSRAAALEATINRFQLETDETNELLQAKAQTAKKVADGYTFEITEHTRDIRDFRPYESVDTKWFCTNGEDVVPMNYNSFMFFNEAGLHFGFDGKKIIDDPQSYWDLMVDYVDPEGVIFHWTTNNTTDPEYYSMFIHKRTCPKGMRFPYERNVFYSIVDGQMVKTTYGNEERAVAFPEAVCSKGTYLCANIYRTGPFMMVTRKGYTSFYNPATRKKLTFTSQEVKYVNIPLFNKLIFTYQSITVEVPKNLLY